MSKYINDLFQIVKDALKKHENDTSLEMVDPKINVELKTNDGSRPLNIVEVRADKSDQQKLIVIVSEDEDNQHDGMVDVLAEKDYQTLERDAVIENIDSNVITPNGSNQNRNKS